MLITRIKRFLVGSPLSNEMMEHERLSKWKALAILSSDALSSVAYATQEAMIPLAAAAATVGGMQAGALAWSMPIALAIGVLIFIITMSYRQTIDAYPGGGGAYTVARDNLGVYAGLVAGAALLIDYVLTVSVSIAAGMDNLASAFPLLHAHKEALGVFVILVLMFFNLRGVRESANIFVWPTYFFIISLLILIVTGVYRLSTGQLQSVHPVLHESYPPLHLFVLLKAFASGCSALTGIEAISNGIPLFEQPQRSNAKKTMVAMTVILASLFISITLLAHKFGIHPPEDGQITETTVSLLARNILGNHWFYYVVQASTTLILILAANTSYADFPRLASLLANDRYLPRQLSSLGDRLVFSNGIAGLSLGAIALVIFFRGDTHSLMPLYAVGVFLSFTLSQAGMVKHHLKLKQPGWKKGIFFSFIGALTTLMVLLIIGATKFLHGAWMVVLLIPLLVFMFQQVHSHYLYTARKLSRPKGVCIQGPRALQHTAIIPVSGIHQGVIDSISYALSISKDVRAVYVELNPKATENLRREWSEVAPMVPLVVLKSPYRSVIAPIVDYITSVDGQIHGDVVTVIIPEFVISRWYHGLLHNQTAIVLYAALRGRKGIIVTSVRYHLDDEKPSLT